MRGELVFDRSLCGTRCDMPHIRRVKIAPQDGKLSLRLILDGNCAEFFVNDGAYAFSTIVDTPPEADGISLHSDGAALIDVTYHAL